MNLGAISFNLSLISFSGIFLSKGQKIEITCEVESESKASKLSSIGSRDDLVFCKLDFSNLVFTAKKISYSIANLF